MLKPINKTINHLHAGFLPVYKLCGKKKKKKNQSYYFLHNSNTDINGPKAAFNSIFFFERKKKKRRRRSEQNLRALHKNPGNYAQGVMLELCPKKGMLVFHVYK